MFEGVKEKCQGFLEKQKKLEMKSGKNKRNSWKKG
jgi:hypothetical protein